MGGLYFSFPGMARCHVGRGFWSRRCPAQGGDSGHKDCGVINFLYLRRLGTELPAFALTPIIPKEVSKWPPAAKSIRASNNPTFLPDGMKRVSKYPRIH